MSILKRFWPALLGIITLLGLWQLLVIVTGVPDYILPAPLTVVQAFAAHQQLLWHHAGITVIEIVAGLLIGFMSGLGTALALARFHGLRRTLLPILLISQAVPLFALAPILMLWLGYGMTAKIVMATLIIYFPVASTCYDGLRQTPQGWLDLAQTLGANRRRQLLRIQLPAALPSLASGMRMAASAAPIGAVIGEWVGSSQGLGYLMLNANARMQVDLMFAALLILITFGVALYFTTDAVMRRLMPWHDDRTGTTN
ncbi:ABC transporter permease [Chromohalobacter sp. HP20-39]|uniref:ABC transporter permease n=1 Tax=Chromohalobacter sp. HP20-39 TaxID=3079306 RepID=UPI00294AAF87|nr:ABC transporter permease [Chromohalobacter sp. HP20-39]MDV6319193.1 ABC transporter permease [Chromohalobacter sp. HP20-39]